MKSAILCLSLLVLAADVRAQDHETVLLPIAAVPASGAFGSRWVTTFHLHNENSVPVDPSSEDIYPLDGLCGTQPPCRTHPPLMPGETSAPELYWRHGGGPGALLHVRSRLLDDLVFQLRVQDISRQSLTWGTEIPVVRESEFLDSTSSLIEIPMDERFRQTLRVYEPDSTAGSQIRLRVYSSDETNAVIDTVLTLLVPDSGPCPSSQRCYPAYAEITHLRSSFPELAAFEKIRVELQPLTEGQRYWAFVSVTNNETQHVTTITPQ